VLTSIGLSAPARADTVTDWNVIATDAVFSAPGQGASATAQLAMVHGAMYDAVNAIDKRYQPYLVAPRARRWYSQDAAAATAAYRVLVDSRPPLVQEERQPDLAAALAPVYAASLAAIPDGRAKDRGIDVGNAAADAMIAARADDGRWSAFRFTPGTLPGEWRLTSVVNDPFAWLKDLKPFLVRSSSQFRGRPPLRLRSRRYSEEFNEVKTVGAVNSSARTDDQTKAAQFWGLANGVATWSRIYRSIADGHGGSLADNARLFAMLYTSDADALITVWTDKARYSFWRPITAIREADSDGNGATMADPEWVSLIPSPPYPDHPSGLSALAGASVETLQDFFGTDDFAFGATVTPAPPPPPLPPIEPITRNYTSFSQARDEIVDARVWGGVHFRTADVEGARIGERVGEWRQRHYFKPLCGRHDRDRGHD
jgi:hypothetical protein